MNWHYYIIYGKIVRSNIEISALQEVFKNTFFDLTIVVQYQKLPANDRIYIVNSDKGYIVKLGKFAQYSICNSEKIILCVALNYEAFFSTVFNIPFSVYFTQNYEILFHACTLHNHNKENLVCISGNKGVGKSTITSLISDSYIKQYSDDTILITKNLNGYRAHNMTKYTRETAELFGINYETNLKNLSDKIYVSLQCSEKNNIVVSHIIQLFRGSKLGIDAIESDVLKKQMFVNNIVGINYFNKELIHYVYANDFYKKIHMFKMSVPNDLNVIADLKDEIRYLILDIL